LKSIKTVLSKELYRIFKDKKMIFSIFILPIILIVGMLTLVGTMAKNASSDVQKHVSTVYIQNAPSEFKSLMSTVDSNSNGIIFLNVNDDTSSIQTDILKEKTDLLIVFPDNFSKSVTDLGGANLPSVLVYYNPSVDYSASAESTYVNSYLEAYRQNLLVAKYGNINEVKLFDIQQSIVQDEAKATGKMLGSLFPYLITIVLFIGAMSLGIDTIAGEKERGTMASLLMTPVKRTSIVMGKLIALMILSVISAAVYVITMVVAIPIMIKSKGSGMDLSGLSIKFTPMQIFELVVIMVGLVFLYVALIGIVAVYAKSVKEASTFIMPLYFVIIATGMMTMYGTSVTNVGLYAIPLYNSAIALKAILSGDITMMQFVLTAASTFTAAGVVTVCIGKAFNSEKVMFNA